MGPIALFGSSPLKRSSFDAGFDADFDAPMPKQRRHHIEHHRIHWKQAVEGEATSICQDSEAVQSLLSRSIGLALEAVGFERAEPVAMESFRAAAEQYMAHFLSVVRQTMLSSRRTQAIPQDFLRALDAHQLTLRALLPHLDPPVLPRKSQPVLIACSAQGEENPRQMQLINSMLNDSSGQRRAHYIPSHFPALPSQHTYRAKAVYAQRDRDPRTLRERATEESRLGEEALRKLVAISSETRSVTTSSRSSRLRSTQQQREGKWWKQTLVAISNIGSMSVYDRGFDPRKMDLDQPELEGTSRAVQQGSPVNSNGIYGKHGVSRRPKPETNLAHVQVGLTNGSI